MFTLSVYLPKYITMFLSYPSPISYHQSITKTVYIFIKMLFPFSTYMDVFNLSEEAANHCKALISVSYYPPPSSISTYSLFIRDRQRVEEIWVFQGSTSTTQKRLTNSSNRAWRGRKCLHLYKLECSIRGKFKKCWHSHWVNAKFKVGRSKWSRILIRCCLFFILNIIQALWLHYQNVSHPIPCSCPLKSLHLPNTCQVLSTFSALMSWIPSKTQWPQSEMYKVLSDVF